ncbi:Cytochrome P450 [Hyaloscypha variabilis]
MEIINLIPDSDLLFIGIIGILGLIFSIVSLAIYRLRFHPLRHIPGPLLARLTYGYQIYYDVFLGGAMPKQLPKLHQKYGPIVRIAPDRVHVNDPEFYKRISGPREDFIKAKYYYGNLGITESVVTIQDVKAHRILRNALNPFFTPQAALDQYPMILEEIKKLLMTLRQGNYNPRLIDLQRSLGQIFVNLTCRTVFGLHGISDEDALTIFDGISSWFANFNLLLAFPLIPRIALRLPDWIPSTFVPGYMCIRQNVRACIEQCKARTKRSGPHTQFSNVFDMLEASEFSGHRLNETQLLHEAIELLAGGVLPTNTTACYAMYFLLTHSQALATLKSELAGLPKNADGIPRFKTSTDASASYLTAVVKETLRLRPAAGPGFLPRVVTSKGIFIGDTFIPGGTIISTSLFSVGTNQALFKDPLTFNPDRWLDPQSGLEEWFVPFSKGPRMCLGKHIAMLSITSVVAAVVSNFELALHETNEETMDWRDQTLLVNRSHIMAFVRPIDLPSPQTQKGSDTMTSAASGRASSDMNVPVLLEDPDTVILPDLFVSWASTPIKLNPNYSVVAREAEIWFKELCKHDDKTHQKYLKADFGYFSGLWASDAAAPEYRTTVDYCNWIWAFDDPFDEGSMKGRPDLIKIELDNVLSVMADNPRSFSPEKHPVMHTFELIWQRIVKRATRGVQRRFRQHQHDYLYQVLEQADPKILEKYTDLESFVANHRESVGAKPMLPLIEYCYGLDVPEFIFEDPAIQRIVDLQAELILLANDVYSYARESKAKHYHNVVHILRKGGMTQQEALDHVGEAVLARYLEFDSVVTRVPSWGEKVDAIVKKYIEISKVSVIANLEWSFQSKRYFGSQNDFVRKTRRVPAIPFDY